jgi:hypothetical protein
MSSGFRALFVVFAAAAMIACGNGGGTITDITDGGGDVLEAAQELPPVAEEVEPQPEVAACATDDDCLGHDYGPCARPHCNPDALACEPLALPDHVYCDDGDPCTTGDTCLQGVCSGGRPVTCDDANPCTQDACKESDGQTACTHTPLTGDACDDGNLCTLLDACAEGHCLGTGGACECADDADCSAFEDGNLCNGTLTCKSGACTVAPASVIQCDNPFDPPCLHTACEPATGLCRTDPLEDGVACDDGNPCTLQDACLSGTCRGSDNDCPACVADADCSPFDDHDKCDGALRCMGGACEVDPATLVVCQPPATQCEARVCVPGTGQCQVLDKGDGAACSDGNLCTTGDRCQASQCVSVGSLECDDGNPCTVDSCSPASGCILTFNSLPCDDQDACTLDDKCQQGQCTGGAPRVCDDDNPCTRDECVPSYGCAHVAQAAECEDGNPCTDGDTCSGGVCLPGANACPCVTDLDCAPHDNENRCDGVLICVNQRCVVKPGSVVHCDPAADTECKLNVCDPANGTCGFAYLVDGTPCTDGDQCTVSDRCEGGACIPGLPRDCSDGQPCTHDTCSVAFGCVNEAIPGCTGCQTAEDCRDGNPCTDDSCDPDSGACSHPALQDGSGCSDGDACTGGDLCQGGACLPGQVDVCGPRPCAAAAEIVCEQVVAGQASGSDHTDVLDHYSCNAFDFSGPEKVYHFRPGQSGTVTATLFDETSEYVILLRDLGDGCNTGACAAVHTMEWESWVDAGQDYYLVVDGYGGAAESYTLKLDCSWTTPEKCFGDADEDLDGLTDCDDPDCAYDPHCRELACSDKVDGDLDGLVDCVDPDCFPDEDCTGGWSGERCEDSFVLQDGQALDASWIGRSLVRWFTTQGAIDDLAGSCNSGAPDTADVAYYLGLADSMQVTFNLGLDASANAALYLYSGTCAPDFELGCALSTEGVAEITRRLDPGDYFVVVDGADAGANGVFALTLSFAQPIPAETACSNAADDDFDGLTDCADPDCASKNLCLATDQCLVGATLGCGQEVQTDLSGSDVTDVVSDYSCPGYSGTGYVGPEHTTAWIAQCDGTATATLASLSGAEAMVDLFVLAGEAPCDGQACLAVGYFEPTQSLARVTFPTTAGASYRLVADGFSGAVAATSLGIHCTCSEVCDNGQDDDLDGDTDCLDADCAGSPECPVAAETVCFDGLDDDSDGLTDCADPDCLALQVCPEVDCADGVDGNLDGLTDCDDPDCAAVPLCASITQCLPQATLQCGDATTLHMQDNLATRAVASYVCDAYGGDYFGNEVSVLVSPGCDGTATLEVKDLDPVATANFIDLFLLDASAGCLGSACTQAVYGTPATVDVPGGASVTLPITSGTPFLAVVEGYGGYQADVSVTVTCECN